MTYDGISRSCRLGDHKDCEGCSCPHHFYSNSKDEIEEDPFEAFDAMNGKPLLSCEEIESERRAGLRK